MLNRTSKVNKINIATLAFSSVLQIGDSTIINGFSRAIAVQREAEIFYSNEGNFDAYSIFREPIPLPALNEAATMFTHHLNPVIKVNSIDIIGTSASSVIHIGNTQKVSLEARVKHIRQLLPMEEEQSPD
ncbi:spore germination protein GerPE [Mesobacillus harenae]|uniref:spore germination protein GerPE n=1 Tax=Mesobacillus harenae TaxID=2213203 RepID=UPI00158103F1|nr:spore germination protein GerPE [Mesobacillus harenae]